MWMALTVTAWALPTIDAPLKTGEKHTNEAAVVIGIEDYAFLDDVPHARRDAAAFYDFLVYTRGVPAANVRRLDKAASREKMLAALDEVAADGDGPLWVYYAGHGAASPSTGERMLLGVDAQADAASFQARAVPVTEIQKKAGSRPLLMVMDTCYSGTGRSGSPLLPGSRFAVPDYGKAKPAAGLQWTAASADQISGPLDDASHGAFTYLVIGALRGWADGQLDDQKDGKVTANEAHLYVSQSLKALNITSQTPVLEAADAERVLSRPGANAEAGPTFTAPAAATVLTDGGELSTFSSALLALETAVRTKNADAVWEVSLPSSHFKLGTYDAMDEVLVMESHLHLPGQYPSCYPRRKPTNDTLVVPPQRALVIHGPRTLAAEVQRAWEQKDLTLKLHFAVSGGKTGKATSSTPGDCPNRPFEPRPKPVTLTANIVPVAGQLESGSGMVYPLHERDLYGSVRLVEVPPLD